MSLNKLQSAKYLEKKRKRRIVSVSLISIAVLASIFLLLGIFRLPFLQIRNIEIQGTSTLDTSIIQKNITEKLQGNYLYIIPRSNIFFYSKKEILDNLIDTYPQIETLLGSVEGFSTLSLAITERKPEVIVCEGFKEDGDGQKCSFADSQAVLFELIPENRPENYFTYYSNSTASSTAIGNTFIDKVQFIELQKFVANIKAAGLTVTGMLIEDSGAYELYILNPDKKSNAVVYFDTRIPLEKTASNLLVFWQNALNKKIGLNIVPNFDYINLRFGNNVFYLVK